MKNISLILNAILFVLVGILFYLHFSSKKTGNSQAIKTLDGKTQTITNLQIAYFDIDSFQSEYVYFRSKKTELENKQKAIETEIAKDEQKLQNLINSYQQKAETMTEEEYYTAQQKVMVEQQKIQQKSDNYAQSLMKQTEAFNKNLMESIINYLKEYNADNKYSYILPYTKESPNLLYVDPKYDITADIIKGMNEQYKKK